MGSLTPVRYAPVRTDPAFQRVLATRLGFDGALEVVRAVLAERDLWIIHEIDPHAARARRLPDRATKPPNLRFKRGRQLSDQPLRTRL